MNRMMLNIFFYKDYPRLRLDVTMPEIHRDDIVMIGSYYAVTPQLRDKVKELLDKAREKRGYHLL